MARKKAALDAEVVAQSAETVVKTEIKLDKNDLIDFLVAQEEEIIDAKLEKANKRVDDIKKHISELESELEGKLDESAEKNLGTDDLIAALEDFYGESFVAHYDVGFQYEARTRRELVDRDTPWDERQMKFDGYHADIEIRSKKNNHIELEASRPFKISRSAKSIINKINSSIEELGKARKELRPLQDAKNAMPKRKKQLKKDLVGRMLATTDEGKNLVKALRNMRQVDTKALAVSD